MGALMRPQYWLALALTTVFVHSALAQNIGQKIAFVSWRDANYEIYVMDPDGNNQTRLTNHPATDDAPRWSPDGTRILFESLRDPGFGEIYVMNADGSGQMNLTNNPARDFDAQWSPNGARILFHSTRSGPDSDIFVMNADGSDKTNLTDSKGLDEAGRWSPDGTRIAFQSSQPGQKGSQDIYVVNADGSGQMNLTNSSAFDSAPRWSPDGTRIAFASRENHLSSISVIKADGSVQANLTLSNFIPLKPAQWSPDGTRVLALRPSGFGSPAWILVFNADGSGQPFVASAAASDEEPQWSPDGTQILFVSSSAQSFGKDIYVMNADGSNQRNLTSFVQEDRSPQFSPARYLQRPSINAGGIVLGNLAPAVNTVSPLSIVSVFGMGLSDEVILFPNVGANGNIDTMLGGTCVETGGERLPIFAITPTQANVQMPATPMLGPVGVFVIRHCDTPDASPSIVANVSVEEATPGFFLFPPLADAGLIAARFNFDNVAVAPDGMFTDEFGSSRPAVPGDIIVLYGTGWGATTAALGTGELAPGAAELLPGASPTVSFGGIILSAEDVLYVGGAPTTAGLYQLVIRVPAIALPGKNKVVLTVFGKSTPIGPVVPVATP